MCEKHLLLRGLLQMRSETSVLLVQLRVRCLSQQTNSWLMLKMAQGLVVSWHQP